MSRNTDNHFGLAPMKDIRRSSFKRPCTHSTTFNTGELIPFYSDEVLPGDTCKMKTSALIRMTTPIYPVMDNAWLDTYYFFIPNRLIWEHWEEFMGENKTDAWTQTSEFQIPQVVAPEGGWTKGTIAEKIFGCQGREFSASALYFRAYAKCFNEWFRSENVSEPAEEYIGDADTTGSNGNDYVTDLIKGGMPAKVVKYADYFTRALPEPQKGPDVYIPIGATAPIIGVEPETQYGGQTSSDLIGKKLSANQFFANVAGGITQASYYDDETGTLGSTGNIGLAADLRNAEGATINQLRQAYAVQRMYEIDARGGTRYTEILRAHFGVISPDSRLQRPEYLGGKRIPINITQVIQQSATNEISPQGTTAAYSLTIDVHEDFTKSFTEHGIILGLCCIRTEHSYQQGLERRFSRKNRVDYYWPALANIGEQAILQKEIFCGTETDDEVFGYQERWAEYRYATNKVTGEMNSDYTTPLDYMHYADDYAEAPTLSNDWISETDENVKRTLAIQTQDQWQANFYFDQTWIRPMPIYSIPQITSYM